MSPMSPASSNLPGTSITNGSPPLGQPLPLDEHACSVALPLWSHIVGYEEGDPNVANALACGYPRFVYHPYLQELMVYALKEYDKKCDGNSGRQDCILMPSKAAGNRCRDFIVKAYYEKDSGFISPDNCVDLEDTCSHVDMEEQEHRRVKVMDLETCGVHAVIFPAETGVAIEAKSYWQHTGEIVSSRRASAALQELNIPFSKISSSFNPSSSEFCLHKSHPSYLPSPTPLSTVRSRIADITDQPDENVFLTPSGMQSIHAALRLARRFRHEQHKPRGETAVFGFPYLDTLKMAGRKELSDGVEFFGFGDARDLNTLRFLLKSRAESSKSKDAGITCLFTEFPSNPLLNVPDLRRLRELADEYQFLLIVDDTLGNFANVDLLKDGIADVICTSLTKLFNGRGDAIAGSVVIGKEGRHADELVRLLKTVHNGNDGDLWIADAKALEVNSEDFLERSSRINENTEKLADWLNEREEVDSVFYPKFTQPELYNRFLNTSTPSHTSGYGGLFALILHEHICERTFYDNLEICKGPSLGTNFTLACPYTLLAHYHELEFAQAYDVSPRLIRVAVGLEAFDEVRPIFERALEIAKVEGGKNANEKVEQAGGGLGGVRSYSTRAFEGGVSGGDYFKGWKLQQGLGLQQQLRKGLGRGLGMGAGLGARRTMSSRAMTATFRAVGRRSPVAAFGVGLGAIAMSSI
ncbi:hypothetical protein TrLO_g2894 [Triparma laevis f. longispina]|uniref:Cystathionine gamma-synthase n=1 Tax=Triparma laevis f. longispina TaxID=1714387 RepID=A0A9W7ABT8_9STRA|nr:hypothetical protein TrLO_g2894 [Triparma laevis f. longispina]